jgi:hypothetical protein
MHYRERRIQHGHEKKGGQVEGKAESQAQAETQAQEEKKDKH